MFKHSVRLLIAFILLAMVVPNFAQDDLYIPIGSDDRFNWDSLQAFADANDFTGEELTIFGPWITVDEGHVEAVIDYFEWATGATVDYTGSDDFEQLIRVNVESGDPPNLAVFPQPGLAADFAADGNLVPLGEETGDWLNENYAAGSSWVALSTYADENGNDQVFAFPYKIDVKSLVWYVPDNFADAGYEVPETMEELIALSEQMVADGNTPWCIGLESGGATGWPATDWVEDIMLRTQSPEVYDQWVENEIPFDDERVVNAIQTFGMFAKDSEWVAGGPSAVATTSFRDAPNGLFSVPADCFMHRQASFITSFFPEDAELGVDVDFFYFPEFESEDLGSPVLGAGTLFAMTEESPAAFAFIEFLKTPLAHEIWMSRAGFLTPFQDVNPDTFADDVLRGQNEILLNATTFRFDASDLMPGAIGAGAFWTAMVDFVNGDEAEDVASFVQRTWEELGE